MKFHGDKGTVVRAHSAAFHASPEDKKRAEKAQLSLKQPWVYNAFLLLLHDGAKATESKILAEAKRLHAANDRFLGVAEAEERAA